MAEYVFDYTTNICPKCHKNTEHYGLRKREFSKIRHELCTDCQMLFDQLYGPQLQELRNTLIDQFIGGA